MALAKFQENWFRIDGEITENHAILVNLTTSITLMGAHHSVSENVIPVYSFVFR